MGKQEGRILVSLPKGINEIIRTKLVGKIGDSQASVVKHIVVAYLSEKGYLKAEEGTK